MELSAADRPTSAPPACEAPGHRAADRTPFAIVRRRGWRPLELVVCEHCLSHYLDRPRVEVEQL